MVSFRIFSNYKTSFKLTIHTCSIFNQNHIQKTQILKGEVVQTVGANPLVFLFFPLSAQNMGQRPDVQNCTFRLSDPERN